MATTTNTVAPQAPRILSPPSPGRRLNPRVTRSKTPAEISVGVPIHLPVAAFKSSVVVRASDPEREEVNSSTEESGRAFTSQEDLNYLWKLGAGSIAGAAAIKYGSALFPDITRPNLLEAMIIISSPVIVAVLLLIWQSRIKQ
ncbi:hypothetical protein RHGRI_035193 [Rhododendron griersonianum]|uniref:Uncharacterized protein n=1 Tax=Rhododendron griersonianum TaxID=479676 RepID=A0AAV6I6B1_9ERIC|nr:hypothetical protein RHGRI_035193 [Rhododendron griersonianum]